MVILVVVSLYHGISCSRVMNSKHDASQVYEPNLVTAIIYHEQHVFGIDLVVG